MLCADDLVRVSNGASSNVVSSVASACLVAPFVTMIDQGAPPCSLDHTYMSPAGMQMHTKACKTHRVFPHVDTHLVSAVTQNASKTATLTQSLRNSIGTLFSNPRQFLGGRAYIAVALVYSRYVFVEQPCFEQQMR
jgi:hypothetical protein